MNEYTPLDPDPLPICSLAWCKTCWRAFAHSGCGQVLFYIACIALTGVLGWGWYMLNVALMQAGVLPGLGSSPTSGIAALWVCIQLFALIIIVAAIWGVVAAVIRVRDKLDEARRGQEEAAV